MRNKTPITVVQLQAPLGADHWRKIFNLAHLTLLPGSFERVQQALQHSHSNADKVASAMRDDPALCLHLFMRANRLVERSGNELHSLQHIISLLGFSNVGQILKSLPVAERPLPFYWQQLQSSVLRYKLLMRLPLHNLGIDSRQLGFAVLFSDCDQWLRWHFAAKQQNHFMGLARNPKIGSVNARQLVFGTDLDTQLRATLQQQSLPGDLKDSLKQSPLQLKRMMKELLKAQQGKAFSAPLHKRQCLIFLLDRLAANFCHSPEHRSTRRYQQLLAQLLQVAETSVSQSLHQVAGELAPLHPSLIDSHPARRLLCKWPKDFDEPFYALPSPQDSSPKPSQNSGNSNYIQSDLKSQIQNENTPSGQSVTAKAAALNPQDPSQPVVNRLLDNRFLDANLVRQLLQALSKGHPNLNSLNNILQALSQALEKGMGMAMGAILVPATDASWHAKFQFNDQEPSAFEQLPQATLFTKMSTKPMAILVNKDNRAAIRDQLPNELSAALQSRELLLVSIFLNTKLIAILLAGEIDLAPPRVHTCKRLAQATQQAIARLAVQVQRQAARH